MKKLTFTLLISLILTAVSAKNPNNYTSLDPKNPITFNRDYITYNGQKITLNEIALFVD